MVICNIKFEKKYIRNLPHTAALAKLRSKINVLKSKGDMVGALTTVEEVSYYKKKHKFSWKNSANWLLLPNMLTMSLNFFAIRGLTELPYQPFLDSSFLWIPDLCQRDPYFVIPAINAAAICYVMKYGIDSGENKILQDALSNKIVLISLMAGMGAIQSMFPAALVLYWFASNAIGIGVIGPALKNDNFRSRVGLLSMEEKREAVKVLPDLTTLQNDITEGFQEVRKEGHQTDMEERKKRLENLKKEINSEEDLDEMKKSLNEMKNELNQKRIDLEKLTKETDEIEKSLKDRATSA